MSTPGGCANTDCPAVQKRAGPSATAELPTLQGNALRRLFQRRDFTPADVAALGYRQLARMEGIGCKRLMVILDWLARHGAELDRPMPSPHVGNER